MKYEGYIKRQLVEIERFQNLEQMRLAPDFDYGQVHGLSNELKEKLDRIRPESLGQAIADSRYHTGRHLSTHDRFTDDWKESGDK